MRAPATDHTRKYTRTDTYKQALVACVRAGLLEARMQLLRACGRLDRVKSHACAHTRQTALRDAHKHAQSAQRSLHKLERAGSAEVHAFREDYRDVIACTLYLQTTPLFVTQMNKRINADDTYVYFSTLVNDFVDLPRIDTVFGDMPPDGGMYD
jgi:hypothetical protein